MTEKGVSRRTWERRRRSEIAVDAVWTVRPNSQVEIPDVYATPLRQAGWLDYVVANVDQLDFVRAHSTTVSPPPTANSLTESSGAMSAGDGFAQAFQ